MFIGVWLSRCLQIQMVHLRICSALYHPFKVQINFGKQPHLLDTSHCTRDTDCMFVSCYLEYSLKHTHTRVHAKFDIMSMYAPLLAGVCPGITVSHGSATYTPGPVYGLFRTYTSASVQSCNQYYIPTEYRSSYTSSCQSDGTWSDTLSCQGDKLILCFWGEKRNLQKLHEMWWSLSG